MIDIGFSIHYSDLMTLAGLQRIFSKENMPQVPGGCFASVDVGVRVERDDKVPAGMIEVRWKDGRRELMVLPLEKPRPFMPKASA